MEINSLNGQIINSRDVYIHDDIFESIQSTQDSAHVAGILHSLQHRIAPAGELFRQGAGRNAAGK